MKVLTLSNSPLLESQGSGYVIVNYARGLSALGHEVQCIGPEAFELWPRLVRAKRWRLAVGMALFATRQRLFRGFDLVEFYGAEAWLTVALLRISRSRCTLIQHSNGLETRDLLDMARNSGADTHSGEPRRWYQLRAVNLLTVAFTWVDGLVLVSRFEHRFASLMRYQPFNRMLAIENPLPQSFLGQAMDLGRPRSLGFCGAWIWRKGTSQLVTAASTILRAWPDVTLELVGVGPSFDKRRVFEVDICDRVHVTPFIESKAALQAWYQSVSILLLPAYYESFGLVAAEAMACGCAVVASPTGFAADLIDGQEAIVTSGFGAEQLIAAVERLLQDDALRERVARGGHQRVQSLNWTEATKELESFYLKCLGSSASGVSRATDATGDASHRARS